MHFLNCVGFLLATVECSGVTGGCDGLRLIVLDLRLIGSESRTDPQLPTLESQAHKFHLQAAAVPTCCKTIFQGFSPDQTQNSGGKLNILLAEKQQHNSS